MKIDRLSDNRVLVVICEEEFSGFSIDYDALSFKDERSKVFLLDILRNACKETGLNIRNKQVTIEALRLESDVYILISLDKKRRKTYRFKVHLHTVCYNLGESGNFLDAMEKLYRERICCNRNSVYLYNNGYYLIFDYPNIPKRLRCLLSEYSRKRTDSVTAARVRENGKIICKQNAIMQIGRFLV